MTVSRYTIENGYRKKAGTFHKLKHVIPVFALLFVVGAGYNLKSQSKSETPTLSESVSALSTTEQPKQNIVLNEPIPWPHYGQAAYGVKENGVLAKSESQQKPVPVASLAKVITALAILKQKPLNPGEQGPLLTLGEEDVESYNKHLQKDGSVTLVEVGEQITQYEAMLAMMLPSSNNMSESLARWAFGSEEAYVKYANKMVKDLGLTNTTVADASGFSPLTVSTADDMVKLGIIYMQNPVLKQIALMPEAKIPVAGIIPNYNSPLNKDGVVGIKVGYTDEAGRSFLVASLRKDGSVTAAAALGAPDLRTAMADAINVLNAGNTGYDKISAKP